MKKSSDKLGRPKNFTEQEIILVINQYAEHINHSKLITASDVARFAQSTLNMPNFKYYVIQRNANCKSHLEEINERIGSSFGEFSNSDVALFKTIDVQAYLEMNKQHLSEALQNLNVIIEAMADKQSRLIKDNHALHKQIATYKEEIDAYKADIDAKEKMTKETRLSQETTIAQLNERIAALEDAVRIAWDKEAESILKRCGEINNDGSCPDTKKTISDIDTDIKACVDALDDSLNEKVPKGKVMDLRKKFEKKLEEL